jgi:hypothetical protein
MSAVPDCFRPRARHNSLSEERSFRIVRKARSYMLLVVWYAVNSIDPFAA